MCVVVILHERLMQEVGKKTKFRDVLVDFMFILKTFYYIKEDGWMNKWTDKQIKEEQKTCLMLIS